ncbi:unnamed protein product [Orchesella dallaii]|uniref:C2H2-type domain-containing protein n=1 Tax=Orchesella dallaii TaxID=48710 RepID=A0ABP1RZ70_9HEXA
MSGAEKRKEEDEQEAGPSWRQRPTPEIPIIILDDEEVTVGTNAVSSERKRKRSDAGGGKGRFVNVDSPVSVIKEFDFGQRQHQSPSHNSASRPTDRNSKERIAEIAAWVEQKRNEVPWKTKRQLLEEALEQIKMLEGEVEKLKVENQGLVHREQEFSGVDPPGFLEKSKEVEVEKEAKAKLEEDVVKLKSELELLRMERKESEDKMKEEIDKLRVELGHLKLEKKKSEDKFGEEVEKLIVELGLLRKERDEEVNKLNAELGLLRKERKQLEDQVACLEVQSHENAQQKILLITQEKKLEKIQKDLDDKMEKVVKLEVSIKNLTEEKEDLESNLKERNSTLERLLKQKSDLEKIQSTYPIEKEQLLNRVKFLERAVQMCAISSQDIVTTANKMLQYTTSKAASAFGQTRPVVLKTSPLTPQSSSTASAFGQIRPVVFKSSPLTPQSSSSSLSENEQSFGACGASRTNTTSTFIPNSNTSEESNNPDSNEAETGDNFSVSDEHFTRSVVNNRNGRGSNKTVDKKGSGRARANEKSSSTSRTDKQKTKGRKHVCKDCQRGFVSLDGLRGHIMRKSCERWKMKNSTKTYGSHSDSDLNPPEIDLMINPTQPKSI